MISRLAAWFNVERGVPRVARRKRRVCANPDRAAGRRPSHARRSSRRRVPRGRGPGPQSAERRDRAGAPRVIEGGQACEISTAGHRSQDRARCRLGCLPLFGGHRGFLGRRVAAARSDHLSRCADRRGTANLHDRGPRPCPCRTRRFVGRGKPGGESGRTCDSDGLRCADRAF